LLVLLAGCGAGRAAPASSSPATVATSPSGSAGRPGAGEPGESTTTPTSASPRRTGSNVLVGSDDNYCAVIKAEWGELAGRSVVLDIGATSSTRSAGSPVAAMQKSLSGFTACTGVAVTVRSDPTLAAHLTADALAGSAPDLAVLDGPALLAPLAATGTLAPAPRLVQADLDKLWDPGWRSAGTVDGVLYASPLDVTAAGLVWYSPRRFAEWGYRVPTTWSELTALSAGATAGGRGWCSAADRGTALGDWLAEVVLRQSGTGVYDAWVAGTVRFTDAAVTRALATIGSLLGLPPEAAGARAGSAGPADVIAGRCAMVLADQEWSSSAAAGTRIGPTGDLYAFPLPPIAARTGTPLRVEGDLLVAFAGRPEVQALRYYLSTAYWAGVQYADSGRISANRGLEASTVTDPIARLTVSLLQQKTAVSRYDALTQMPPAVNAAARTELGGWANGATTGPKALAAIAAAWPAG
jgi:alpha-glucoside transport system substrate-binding protein